MSNKNLKNKNNKTFIPAKATQTNDKNKTDKNKKTSSIIVACLMVLWTLCSILSIFVTVKFAFNASADNSFSIVAHYEFNNASNLGYDSTGKHHLTAYNGLSYDTNTSSVVFNNNSFLSANKDDSGKDFSDYIVGSYSVSFRIYTIGANAGGNMIFNTNGFTTNSAGLSLAYNGLEAMISDNFFGSVNGVSMFSDVASWYRIHNIYNDTTKEFTIIVIKENDTAYSYTNTKILTDSISFGGNTDYTFTIGAQSMAGSSSDCYINLADKDNFIPKLSDFRVYRGVLTDEEISNISDYDLTSYDVGYNSGYEAGYNEALASLQSSVFLGATYSGTLGSGSNATSFSNIPVNYVYHGVDFSPLYNTLCNNYGDDVVEDVNLFINFSTPFSLSVDDFFIIYSSSPSHFNSCGVSFTDGSNVTLEFDYNDDNLRVTNFPTDFDTSLLSTKLVKSINLYFATPEDDMYCSSFVISDAISNDIYNNGYDTGYNKGQSDGYDEGLNKGYDKGYSDGYDKGYNIGLNNGVTSNDYSFFGLISAVVDAPISAVKGLLNFDVFGFNMLNAFTGLFSCCLVIAIIKFLI